MAPLAFVDPLVEVFLPNGDTTVLRTGGDEDVGFYAYAFAAVAVSAAFYDGERIPTGGF